MVYSDTLYAYHLELARLPCSSGGFAGCDMRFSSEYEALESELGKAHSIHGAGLPDWQRVSELGERVLREHSKDLRVAVWLTWALHQRDSFPGLLAGLGVLLHLCKHHWAIVYPAKSRTRMAAFGWLVLRLDPLFTKHLSLTDQVPLFQALLEHLESLDELWREHLGDDAPLLLPIRRQLSERLALALQGGSEPRGVAGAIAQVKQVATQLGEIETKIPTEVLVSDRREYELAQEGFIALAKALADADVPMSELQATLQPRSEQSATRNPVFSQALVHWLQQALMVAHLELGQRFVDEGALLLALLRHPLEYAGAGYQAVLGRLDAERVRDFLASQESAADPLATESLLQRFTHDLTGQAREGLIDPVLCRDGEIRQLIDILVRRRKNNPILVGEAGVGKTAIVEGLALKIVASQVPDALKAVRVLTLDMGLLQAGASLKGEFERRLKGVIDEVNASPQAVILFIDEAHTLVGAGGPAGGSDAANLLKPALARGALRTIAATTWSEYKQYIEKDPALARRFQPVLVGEPSVEEAVSILRGLVPVYEASHGVYVRDDAVVAAAHLSARYLAGRQLPDKAVDVLDTACARVRTRQAMPPEALQNLHAERAEGTRQHEALSRDAEAGLPVDAQALQALGRRLDAIEQERQVVEQQRIQQAGQSSDKLEVCPRLIAEVVSAWTGIPVEQLALEPNEKVLSLAAALRTRILGQEHAVQVLDRALRAVAAGLNNADAPVGVFLLVGPSGVGKTETALALAQLLYGGERFVTTINMSEYQEKHALSRLIGAPPGYVGYGEGGVLTEAVRKRPYSVVLLDEVEKADPEVLNLFYQVFDKGRANDGEGREIDFRNTLILMTSNLGSDCINELCENGRRPEAQVLQDAIQPVLRSHFKSALLARMRVVPYYPIAGPVLHEVVRLKLASLGERLHRRKLALTCSPELIAHMAERCADRESGARYIDQWIERYLLPQMVDRVLSAMATDESLSWVHAGLDGNGLPSCEFGQ